MLRTSFFGVLVSSLLLASIASAQEAPLAPGAPATASTPLAPSVEEAAPEGAPKKERGQLLLGGKVGGLVAFSGLSPNVRADVELGYVFPWAKRSFAAVLDVGYAAPKTEGTQGADPRVAGATYNWHLTQQELTVMPTVVYRLTSLGKVVPYVGIGPRFYFLQSNVKGDVNGVAIKETTEQSTKVGLGVPIGAQLQLGPGAVLAELLLEYGPLDHTATGDSNTGGASLFVGYRFLL
jgi:hypothetical protein